MLYIIADLIRAHMRKSQPPQLLLNIEMVNNEFLCKGKLFLLSGKGLHIFQILTKMFWYSFISFVEKTQLAFIPSHSYIDHRYVENNTISNESSWKLKIGMSLLHVM
jgi:hypothetical protein